MKPSEELNKGYEFTKAQIAELESLRAENAQLKNNHATEVRRARILKERTDLPIERVAAYDKWGKDLTELETLRARLAEIEAQEPVAHMNAKRDMTFIHGPYNPDDIPLFASPVVSPDVEKLIANHNSDMAACHEQFMDVSREVMLLKTELKAARKDAERLDWLLAHSDATVCSDGVYGPFHIWFRYSNRTTDDVPTARAAIDAAIEQAKGGAV